MAPRDVGDENQAAAQGFPVSVSDDMTERSLAKRRTVLHAMKLKLQELQRYPWIGWAFVYTVVLAVFFVVRCMTLGPLIMMYGVSSDFTVGVVIGALGLGFLEDLVCATYFAMGLWVFDALKSFVSRRCGRPSDRVAARIAAKSSTFLVSWLLFVLVTAPFITDMFLVRIRSTRFTFDLVAMAIDEKDDIGAAAISTDEIDEGYMNAAAVVVLAVLFATVRTCASWTSLSRWNPTQITLSIPGGPTRHLYCGLRPTEGEEKKLRSTTTPIKAAGDAASCSSTQDSDSEPASPTEEGKLNGHVTVEVHDNVESSKPETVASEEAMNVATADLTATGYRKRCSIAVVGLALFPLLVIAVSRACTPLIAFSAMNTTLNELLGRALQPSADDAITTSDSDRPWPETFIDRAEEHALFGNDTLYRRTTGFHGDLAFDVDVDPKDPPNVLLLVVESLPFHDSHYLVGEEDPSNLFKGTNITITPSFDRWAKRGIALRNYWSSWRTSRSVESLLFGQLPYDSATRSGMTGGTRDTKLAGLPQLFTAKGYETFFTTGCKTNYDGWDVFLPAHGFDTVWSRTEMMKLAESDLGIKRSDWKGPEHRALNWGVHDDLSFQLLGDLMVNKTKAQAARVAQGKSKKPLFLTHYTISSHVNYVQRPKWYHDAKKPDFSALYKGQKHAENIKNYLEIRYFTDMEFGKFMDRMDEAGILKDTIVVVSGDHGQGPEFGNDVPEDRDVSATRVAGTIIAEGRLGDAVGLVIDDATEQYDILNTLADVTGVPDGGFEQDGVGRSLKRASKFGERVVYSNNPTRKMSVVRGHERLRYDEVTEAMLLHNADTDHDMEKDLLPALPSEQREEWIRWRANGRHVNAYYTRRWEGKCLLSAEC